MRALFLLAILVSCKPSAQDTPSKTSPLGPVGEIDFTKRLNEKIKVPAEKKPNEGKQTICKRVGHTGADIAVKWDTFAVGDDHYIGKAHFDVLRVEEGLEVALADQQPMVGTTNLTPGKPYRAMAQVAFKCRRKGDDSSGLVVFDTEGQIVNQPSE